MGNSYGVFADSFSNNNTIGVADPSDGSLTNAANVIAFNWGRGVTLGYGAGNGNRILSNSIFENGLLGIDFLKTIRPCKRCHSERPHGPRHRAKPPPELPRHNFRPIVRELRLHKRNAKQYPSRKVRRHHRTRIIRQTFIIQFFSSTSADTSGFGEGEPYLGQIEVKTDRQGNASPSPFSFGVNGDLSGQYITATATNKKTGDTSEFSEAERVQGIGPGL
jgi:hypothetical protein